MNRQAKIQAQMNYLGQAGKPFLFILDFDLKNPIVMALDEVNTDEVLYNVNGILNAKASSDKPKAIHLTKKPVSFEVYKKSFDSVMQQLRQGNSYLVNLTCETEISCDASLKEIFYNSDAKYKLWLKDEFVVFSPEIFVTIKNNRIYSHPMKGTIDASLPDAEKQILDNRKETAEHITIVDLIRNDLGMVAKNVRVDKFRYIDRIKTPAKDILQVSSQISGDLPINYRTKIGDIIFKLLPAGSVSGAPKMKTLEIINAIENFNRGYYTGIFGIFDGQYLDSGVMIRFIENNDGKLVYKSGGGITVNSIAESEYAELIDKIYVPVN